MKYSDAQYDLHSNDMAALDNYGDVTGLMMQMTNVRIQPPMTSQSR